MAHTLYQDTYRSYKSGTSKIAVWLRETVESLRSIGVPGRQKSQFKPVRTPSDTQLNVSDYLILAREIESHPQAAVPSEILYTLRNVIDARKICALWTLDSKYGNDDDEGGHAHFVNVLTEVLKLLRLIVKRRREAKARLAKITPDKNESDKGEPNLKNPFEHLTIHDIENDDDTQDYDDNIPHLASEPSILSRSSKDPDKPPKPAGGKLKAALELVEDPRTELAIATRLYFEDWRSIRRCVKAIWSSYAAGETSLIAASSTTNFAINLLRLRDLKIIDTFTTQMTETGVLQYLLRGFCLRGLREQDGICVAQADEEALSMARDSYYAYRQLFLYAGLDKFVASIVKQGIINISQVIKWSFPPSDQRFDAQIDYLIDIWSPRSGFVCSQPDGILDALYELRNGNRISPWMIHAWTLMIDAVESLKDTSTKPIVDMQAIALRALSAHRDGNAYVHAMKRQADSEYQEFLEEFLVQTNPLPRLAVMIARVDPACTDTLAHANDVITGLAFRNPVTCGAASLKIATMLRTAGLSIAAHTRIPASLTCMYHYATQLGIGWRWPDMDLFVELYGLKNIYSNTSQPKTFKEMKHRLMLLNGVHGADLARDVQRLSFTAPKLAKKIKAVLIAHYNSDSILSLIQMGWSTKSPADNRAQASRILSILREKVPHTDRVVAKQPMVRLLFDFRNRVADEEQYLQFGFHQFSLSCNKMFTGTLERLAQHLPRFAQLADPSNDLSPASTALLLFDAGEGPVQEATVLLRDQVKGKETEETENTLRWKSKVLKMEPRLLRHEYDVLLTSPCMQMSSSA